LFTTGQILTAAQMQSLQQTAMGGGSATAKTVSYVLVAADAGTTVAMNAAGSTTITVNTSLFAAGDVVFIQNLGAGATTITAGTATVTTSGSLVLAQNQGGKLYFTSASAAIFFQFATPASSGDIEGVTAGVGISGGGTSGTVTITNSMATTIDAKGDLIAGTGADTFSKLTIGADATVLTADSAEATGMKWAAPSGGGQSYSLISTTNTNSGSTVTVSSLSSYKNIIMVFNNVSCDTNNNYHYVKINGSSTALDYKQVFTTISTPSTYGTAILSGSSGFNSGNSSGITVSYNGSATSTTLSGYFMIENAQNTGVKSCFYVSKAGAATNAESYTGMAMFGGAAVSSISIQIGSGAFQSGSLLLYGSTT